MSVNAPFDFVQILRMNARCITVLIVATAILAFTTRCSRSEPLPPEVVPAVTVARPVRQEVVEWDEYTGYLDAVEFVEVRARISGLIVSAPFESGAIVKQGDLLVKLDERPFQADLDSRLAEEARSAAQVKLAEIELQRVRDLPPEAAVPIEIQRMEASLSEARAVLAGAKAASESARLLVEWCRVTAPITGRISSRYVDPGNLITGGSGTGTLLTTIASIDPIYCQIDADERAVLKYQRLAREGKRLSAREAQIPFLMQLADETTFSHQGVIDFVDNRIDPMTGTIRGRGVLANPNEWLTPGLFARVRVPGSAPYQALLVPDSAVVTDQNQKLLYVVGSNDLVEMRPVQLGALFGKLRAIESGIEVSDRVIINGLMQARPGVKVSPQEGSFPLDSLPPAPPESVKTNLQAPTVQQPPISVGSRP